MTLLRSGPPDWLTIAQHALTRTPALPAPWTAMSGCDRRPNAQAGGEPSPPAAPSSDLPAGGSANDRKRGAAGLRVADCRALARGGVLLPFRGLREAGERERPRHL